MQIGWQSNRCFDRRTGAHTTRLLKFGIFHQNANAGRRVSRVHSASMPSHFRGRPCSGVRTNCNPNLMFFIRSQSWMQDVCSEFRTECRSKARASATSAPVRRQAGDGRASPGLPVYVGRHDRLGISRQDRLGAKPDRTRHKFDTIRLYLSNKSSNLVVRLLANRRHLLYKV